MVRFSTARVEEVVPQKKQRGPSQRAQLQQQYRDALENAINQREALVIELEPDDKPLTIRNRIKRAADVLGHKDVTIRRRKDRIIVYAPDASGHDGAAGG